MLNPGSHNAIVAPPPGSLDLTLGITTVDGCLVAIDFLPAKTVLQPPGDTVACLCAEQLTEYFSNGRFRFDMPLAVCGTEFQHNVWRALQAIPPGQTRSYSDIADQLCSSARAVGNACRANPIPIVVPCHRVVAKQGIGGYFGQTGGARLRIKQWLLNHEYG